MAVQVSASTGYVSSICATSTGRLWCMTCPSTTLNFYYSDDSGATWTQNSSASITGTSGYSYASFFIDADDNAHVSYTASGYLYYRWMQGVGTGTSWGAAHTADSGTGAFYDTKIVAFATSTGWDAWIAYRWDPAGPSPVRVMLTRVSNAGTGPYGSPGSVFTVAESASYDCYLHGFDFHHVAGSQAIQGGTPHLYIAYMLNASVFVVKYTYAAGSFTAGSPRLLVTGSGTVGGLVFDGDRAIVATKISNTTPTYAVYERDAADTTTTTRTPTSATTIVYPQVGYDLNGDIWVVGENYAGTAIQYQTFDRSAGTWGATATLEAEAVANGTVAVRRAAGMRIDTVWDYSGGIHFERMVANSAPTAPAWVTPANFAAADVGAALLLDWNFSDDDYADTQTAYSLRRQIGAGVLYYWRASDSTWQTTEIKNTSTTTAVTLSTGWGSDSDDSHKFAVKTWDSLDTEGVYGAELTVVPSTPDLPTITTPADASTLVTSSLTAVWTVAVQSTYLVELLNSAGTTVLWTSGTQTSTSVREQVIGYTLANSTSYKLKVTTANDEGLIGAADTNSFSVAYTAPATPTVTVTANTPTGAITVEHSNPTPTGSQPTVTSADVYVRCTTGTYADGERPVAGNGIRVKTGLAPGADWIDYAPASGRAYQYLVRVTGDNGTTGDSAWTA